MFALCERIDTHSKGSGEIDDNKVYLKAIFQKQHMDTDPKQETNEDPGARP